MASQKAIVEAIGQIEELAKSGGSVNLRVSRDGDSLQWMGQAGSADGHHAVTDMGMEFTDLVAGLIGKLKAQTG